VLFSCIWHVFTKKVYNIKIFYYIILKHDDTTKIIKKIDLKIFPYTISTNIEMSPLSILIIEKTGTVKETTIKSFDESDLYKKAGFKSADGFKCHTTWDIEELDGISYSISVYGKTNGRANQENKYEFPPPIDNTLFFGSCIIINKNAEIPTSITSKEWDKIYDHLYGGFEDLGEEDSEEEESDDDDVVKTKTGYAKDGFVVDDDVVDEEDDESSEDVSDDNNEDDEIPRTKKLKNTKPTKTKNKNTAIYDGR
jgi:hypothetical protein